MTKRYNELLNKFGRVGLTGKEQIEFDKECRVTDMIDALEQTLFWMNKR